MVSGLEEAQAGPMQPEHRQLFALLALAAAFMGLAVWAGAGQAQLAFAAVGLTLGLSAVGIWATARLGGMRQRARVGAIARMVRHDPGGVFVTDDQGVVQAVNPALAARMRGAGAEDPLTLLEAFQAHPRATLLR